MKKTIQNKIEKYKELEKKLEDIKGQQIDIELQIEGLWETKKSNAIANNGKKERVSYTEEVLKIFYENPSKGFRANEVQELMEGKLGEDNADINSVKSTIVYLYGRKKIEKITRGKYKAKQEEKISSEENQTKAPVS